MEVTVKVEPDTASFSMLGVRQSSALSGKHLFITGLSNAFSFNLERNSSGYVTQISGVGGRMLDWLSLYHNFSYSPIQIDSDVDFDDIRNGLVGFILRGECDVAGAILTTLSRAELVDFSHPVVYNPGYYLIPASTPIAFDISIAVLPFQPLVWIGIAMAMLTILIFLYLLDYWYFSSRENATVEDVNKITNVFGFLLRQTRLNTRKSKNAPFLFIGAVWCFTTLILINIYTSLLTSYITAPGTQSLVKSVQELVDRTDIWIVTDKNRNSESLMMSAKSGILKDLGDKLRKRPNSTCKTPLQCANMVKSNPSCAYVATRDGFLYKAMADDFQETQKCNLEIGKEEIYTLRSPWALAKNSPYTEYVNKGIMQTQETGLMNYWMKEYRPNIGQCINNTNEGRNRKNSESREVQKLSLGNLAVIFVALLTGYFVSLLVLIGERFIFTIRETQARNKIIAENAFLFYW